MYQIPTFLIRRSRYPQEDTWGMNFSWEFEISCLVCFKDSKKSLHMDAPEIWGWIDPQQLVPHGSPPQSLRGLWVPPDKNSLRKRILKPCMQEWSINKAHVSPMWYLSWGVKFLHKLEKCSKTMYQKHPIQNAPVLCNKICGFTQW